MSQKPFDDLAGHASPNYAEPDKKLKDLFEKYLDISQRRDYSGFYYDYMCGYGLYDCASSLLEGIQATSEEAHGLLFNRELSEVEIGRAGCFISAVYNKSEEKKIFYNLEIKVSNLAYELPPDKVFVNRGNGYDRSGTRAKGLVINYVENKKLREIDSGFEAKGSVVAYGAIASANYVDCDDEVVETGDMKFSFVNQQLNIRGPFGDPRIGDDISFNTSIWANTKVIYKEEISKLPELCEYVGNLKSKFELGRLDYNVVVETIRSLGPQPHEKIKQNIADILRRAGKDV